MKKFYFLGFLVLPFFAKAQSYTLAEADRFFGDMNFKSAYTAYIQNEQKLNGTQLYRLALIALNKDQPGKNYTEATAWLKKAAAAGNEEAYFGLYELYGLNENPQKDTLQAIKYLTVAAQKNSKAMLQLGQHYEMGVFVSRDEPQAISWYKKAIGAYNYKGYYQLGALELDANRYATAVSYFKAGALKGNDDCMFEYAFSLQEGTGVPKDMAEAAYWFQNVVDKNSNEYANNNDKLRSAATEALAAITGKPLKTSDISVGAALRAIASQAGNGFANYKGAGMSRPESELYAVFSKDTYYRGLHSPLYLPYIRISVGSGEKIDKYQFSSATQISFNGYIVQNCKAELAKAAYKEWAASLKQVFSELSQKGNDDRQLTLTGSLYGTPLTVTLTRRGDISSSLESLVLKMETTKK